MIKEALVVTEQERESVQHLFPCLTMIKDDALREQVIRVWVSLWQESIYLSLDDAPAMPSSMDLGESLVQHTNGTVSGALALATQLEDEHCVAVNKDYLLAAALLHDVDKLVRYERQADGKVEESALARLIPHGVYGAHVALQEGVPAEVAHVITTHAHYSRTRPSTIEGILIEHADYAKLFSLMVANGVPLPPRG